MKVIEVPCLIGDTVYHITRKNKQVRVSTVKRFIVTRSGVQVILRCGKKGRVGKDIFLTEAEAQKKADEIKKLKLEEGGQKC